MNEEIKIENTDMVEGDQLVGVEKTNIQYLLIEAADINVAFSVFKKKLETKDVFVDFFDIIDSLIESKDRRKHDILHEFVEANKYIKEPVVWGGLYAEAKDSALIKRFSEKNITQSGTKKWETRYVLIGASGKRYDTTPTTKGEAVEKAKKLVVKVKEDVTVQVEKVLISHDPTVSIIKYIKDPSEHDNIYMFMCNTVTFDEEPFNDVYERHVELDPVTKQYSIKVETTLEYAERLTV